jgi:TolA-binding protein
MTEPVPSSVAVKRRQYLLLAGVGAVIVIGTVFSVSLTGSKPATERQSKPKSTNILAPGAQVDPRDAWRGQADAQLRAIEQKSRELAQRDSEMEGQSREMIERLRKLEGSGAAGSANGGLTALPPPPIAAPATRPSFGPDAANGAQTGSGQQRAAALPQLPPPPPPQPNRAGSFGPMPAPGSNGLQAAPLSGIVSITLADTASGQAAKPGTDPAVKTAAPRDTRRYHARVAPSPGRCCSAVSTHPPAARPSVTLSPSCFDSMDNAILPNQFRAKREGMLRGGRRLWRRQFRARLHPHRVAVVHHARRHGHRRPGERLCRGRGRQGRHARTPRVQAGADPRQRAVGRCRQRHRSRLHAERDHDVDLAAGHHQHRRPRPSSSKPVWARVWARRSTGSPSTTSPSPRRSSR